LRVLLTRTAWPAMAFFLAEVVSTAQIMPTHKRAAEFGLTAVKLLAELATEAFLLQGNFAWLTRPSVAWLITLMFTTVKCVATCIFATVLRALRDLTWHELCLLLAVAFH
jgi:hypothetical protein